jgi:hypothetical protein
MFFVAHILEVPKRNGSASVERFAPAPPRQKPGSFSLNRVLEKLQEPGRTKRYQRGNFSLPHYFSE